jgi:predicted GNAT family acetyltransferase
MGQKIYQLERVTQPVGVGGRFRLAEESDREVLTHWSQAFAKESLPEKEHQTEEYWRLRSERVIAARMAYLWEVDGAPVATASTGRPTKNGITVSGVYTPPEHRRHGYASALVADICQKMLDSGKRFCTLYTDVANPTSNKIYQAVGFREIAESKHLVFVEAES